MLSNQQSEKQLGVVRAYGRNDFDLSAAEETLEKMQNPNNHYVPLYQSIQLAKGIKLETKKQRRAAIRKSIGTNYSKQESEPDREQADLRYVIIPANEPVVTQKGLPGPGKPYQNI